MAQYDDLNTRKIWVAVIVSGALTVVTILAVQVLYYAMLNRHQDLNMAESEYSESSGYLAEQATEISRYGRDAETGALQIPIDRAMRLVVERASAENPPSEASTDEASTDEASTDEANTDVGDPNSEPGAGDDDA